MREGWTKFRLSEIAEIYNGNSISAKDKQELYSKKNVGMNFIATKDVNFDGSIVYETNVVIPNNFNEKFKIAPIGSTLVCAEGGSAGRKVGYVEKKIHFGNKLYAVIPLEMAETKYFYYFCISNDFKNQFKNRLTGMIGGVSSSKFKSIEIPLPPLTEQKRIVALLDEAFAGIAAAAEAARKNLANARELFETTLNAIFTQKGEGWVETTLGEVCSITSNLVDPKKPEYLDLPHLGAGNMISDTGEIVDVKTAHDEGLISGKFVFGPDAVLYSKIRPYLKKACRPDFMGLCSADVYPLSVKPEAISKDYLYHLLMSADFTDYAISGSSRAGMPKVNRNHLFAYRFWIPDVAKQAEFVLGLDALSTQTQTLEAIYQQKIDALDELKQSLLQKAFAGELIAQAQPLEATA